MVDITYNDLRRGIETDELELYYQPTIALADGAVTGFEALTRWPHRTLGLLPAGKLIPIAEEWGLVRALDDWAMQAACRQLATWQNEELVAPGFRMAVNIDGAELDGAVLVERVRSAIDESGVDAPGLVMELTETSCIANDDDAKVSVDGLHALGVEIALDDFGSQYSTFARLNSFPFDVLKIDRDFVAQSESPLGCTFIKAIVELGDALHARVVAEGIETPEQCSQLREFGAHEGQGFLWAPALAPSEARALLSRAPTSCQELVY